MRLSTNGLMIPAAGFPAAGLPVLGSIVYAAAASTSDCSRDSVKASFVPFCCALVPCIQYVAASISSCGNHTKSA